MTFKVLTTFAFFLLMGSSVVAQQMHMPQQQQAEPIELSESEMDEFLDIVEVASVIQQESQMEMIATLEDAGLSVDRFNEMVQAEYTGGNMAATAEEMEKYESAKEQLAEIEMEMQMKITAAVEGAGMQPARHQEIMAAVQTDPQLQQQFQQRMMERQETQGGGGF